MTLNSNSARTCVRKNCTQKKCFDRRDTSYNIYIICFPKWPLLEDNLSHRTYRSGTPKRLLSRVVWLFAYALHLTKHLYAVSVTFVSYNVLTPVFYKCFSVLGEAKRQYYAFYTLQSKRGVNCRGTKLFVGKRYFKHAFVYLHDRSIRLFNVLPVNNIRLSIKRPQFL